MKTIFAFLLGAILCGAAIGILHAQAKTAASSGVYTAEQATRGAAVYHAKCATCHGDDLAGTGTAPMLAGPDFLSNWTNQPIDALFDKIQVSMPSDQPGSLGDHDVADLIAFLLKSNRFPAGPTELPAVPDRLKQILLDNPPQAAGN